MPKHTKIEILTKRKSFFFLCQEGITYILNCSLLYQWALLY